VTDDEIGFGGFAKLYGNRLAESSLLDCDVATRWVFIFMLSKADARGIFRCATLSGLARAANVSRSQAAKAVDELEAPDPDSTSKENEGCRIKRITGGWKLVTYSKYREYRSSKQIKDAARQKAWRDARDMSRNITPGHAPEAEAEAEAEAEKKDQTLGGPSGPPVLELTSEPDPFKATALVIDERVEIDPTWLRNELERAYVLMDVVSPETDHIRLTKKAYHEELAALELKLIENTRLRATAKSKDSQKKRFATYVRGWFLRRVVRDRERFVRYKKTGKAMGPAQRNIEKLKRWMDGDKVRGSNSTRSLLSGIPDD